MCVCFQARVRPLTGPFGTRRFVLKAEIVEVEIDPVYNCRFRLEIDAARGHERRLLARTAPEVGALGLGQVPSGSSMI